MRARAWVLPLVATTAVLVPSYCLLLAVKLPVTSFLVMSAVVVDTEVKL